MPQPPTPTLTQRRRTPSIALRAGGLVAALTAGALALGACGPAGGSTAAPAGPGTASATVVTTPTPAATAVAPAATPPATTAAPAPSSPATPASTPTPKPTPTLVAGPAIYRTGSTGSTVREVQARLKQLAWYSGDVTDTYGERTTASVRGFQAKRGFPVTGEVDRRTLDKLQAMTRPPTADELANRVPVVTAAAPSTAGLDARCLTGRVLCISKASRSLTWVVDGKALQRFDVRFGSENHPTREGDFTVYRKNRTWTSTLYGSSMPFSMFFSGGEAVHYSSDFAARGYAGASHGCVNVRDYAGLARLFDQVQLGDRVVVS
ncbi:L,D-transpeptidase family protein [Lapillicoccus jejuensis]|uniref:L,D-transpeptidase-like protein n=1 Tax=Lapillicoccus jejuensis TaxID=402171 RepID=A0A542E366_9MICO|nr:L,D-transpeptidase family protein [Lapillicoccus jejuensis]TQJ09767.1 L,D-transpeptidase-like protein [Lapillicoccus jejuensis]